MSRLVVLLGMLLLLAPSVAGAQTIRGRVIDDGTRDPIQGVVVELRSEDGSRLATAQTNVVGHFVLNFRRSGNVTLHLTHLAYTSIDSEPLAIRADEAVQMELRMARTSIPLEPLVVTARTAGQIEGFRERMQRPGSGRFVTRSEIERRPGAQATELLRNLPGVEVLAVAPPPAPADEGGESGGRIGPKMNNNIYLRSGTGRCTPTIFIDGMVVEQLGHLAGIDDLIRPDMLEGVEVYAGINVPAPLYARDACGAVAFWSRPGEGLRRWSWARLGAGLAGFAAAVLLVRSTSR